MDLRVWLSAWLFILTTGASSAPNITAVPSGIVTTNKEETYTIEAKVQVYVLLDSPPPKIAHQFLNRLRNLTTPIFQSSPDNSHNYKAGNSFWQMWELRIQALMQDLEKVGFVLNNSRPKRGLFDIIGHGLKFMFGTATIDDIDNIKNVQKELTDTVMKLKKKGEEVVGIVNEVSENQKQIEEKVNEVIEKLGKVNEKMYSLANDTYGLIGDNTKAIWLTSLLSTITTQIRQYQNQKMRSHLRKVACQSRDVNEDLIPLEFIKQVSHVTSNKMLNTKLDHELYYQYMTVKSMFKYEGNVYCKIEIPLVGDERFITHHIQTFPVKTPYGYVRRFHDAKISVGTWREDLYYPTDCKGQNPLICHAIVMYDKRNQRCSTGLISGHIEDQAQCAITYYKEFDVTHSIQSPVPNRFLVYTPSVTATYRCAHGAATTHEIGEGLYLISVEEGCNLYTEMWRLQSIQIIDVTINFEESPVDVIDIQPLPEIQLERLLKFAQAEHIEKLELSDVGQIPEMEDTAFIDIEALVPKWFQEPTNWIVVLIVAIVVAAVVYKVYRSKSRRRQRTMPIYHNPDEQSVA